MKTSSSVPRRGILVAGTAAAITGLFAANSATASPAPAENPGTGPRPKLKFAADGKFKIVQFNDTQDGPRTDRRTIELMEKVLDAEKPGFALINGDVINGSSQTVTEGKQAINNVVQPMESRGIPWALTFGNHDEDSMPNGTGMDEAKILNFIRGYEFNANSKNDKIVGESNSQLLLASSKSAKPVFGIWLLDSNRYAPKTVGGQDFEGLMSYDWIRPEQIAWYREASIATENRYGKVQSLMFFHIPLWEHNHINTYMGDYYGIELGYGPGTGFGTYGLGGTENHHLRGARVFELDENKNSVYAGTRTVFSKDLGIDMGTQGQPIEGPLPLP
ncbi:MULTISPECIES: metallophosphoesterase family protein [unclassified Glutamicibacter]|uniref:metallophosphoesterase family protein n=1 Tax=unclassified Glutamicibacter TaxID=2627139 RepID=UPI00380B71C2